MPQEIHHHTFANGLTLLAERMEHVRSATLNFLVPAGCINDPPKHLGIASVLTELIVRGAGKRDSRELALALDNLGVDRDESVGGIHVHFWAGRWPAACRMCLISTPTSSAGRTFPKTSWSRCRRWRCKTCRDSKTSRA